MKKMNRAWIMSTTLLLGACAGPGGSGDLLGSDLSAVRSRLGPPLSATVGGGVWRLAYHDAGGSVVEDAVVAIDGVVVRAAADVRPNQAGGAPAWTGATVRDLVTALGEVRVDSVGQGGTEITCGGMRFVVADGRIVAAR
jgi:hypothetical protein